MALLIFKGIPLCLLLFKVCLGQIDLCPAQITSYSNRAKSSTKQWRGNCQRNLSQFAQAQLESLMEFDERVHDTLSMSPCIQILIDKKVQENIEWSWKYFESILHLHFSVGPTHLFDHFFPPNCARVFVFLSRRLRRSICLLRDFEHEKIVKIVLSLMLHACSYVWKRSNL